MALYIVTYDIRKRPDHDYQPLYDLLNTWGAGHLQNSVWLANLNGKASEVRDALKRRMHADDTFCVIEIFSRSDWATMGARKTGIDWLRSFVAVT